MDLKKIREFILSPKNSKLLVLALLAVLVITVINLFDNGSKKVPVQSDSSASDFNTEQYVKSTEQRVRNILTNIEGVGKAEVMVTVEGGVEYEYASEANSSNDYSYDTDGTGKETTQKKDTRDEKYLIVNDQSGGEKPIILKRAEPQILGIIVVCDGGGEPRIRLTIMEAMKTAFDIPTNRVYVAKK